MKIISAPSLGGKTQDPLNLMESKKVPREIGVVGGDLNINSQQNKSERNSKAISPTQATDFYKVRGAIVDKLA
ncbi:MAG: hypothetical protein L6Q54_10025 [Leptospiraceae bacterium]|nr:hypothetical protein [Leptospiraceae bacterium]MCK6381564.1 hypothetical protein [Leptospiraceae bacterium]NUM41673.1 hypothetical protein [Leptospiraceae bacterium]